MRVLYQIFLSSPQFKALFVSVILLSNYELRSQSLVADPSFNSITGANGTIWASCLQADGKIVIGGEFTNYNGISSQRLARINSNGSIDNSFNIGLGFNGIVWVVDVQSDGKILVGGSFSMFNGVSCSGIIRLNIDGSRDNSFNPPQLINVRSIKIQNSNGILIGGLFSSKIVRLTNSGASDQSFVFASPNILTSVLDIELQADGKILIGGGVWHPNRSVYRLFSNGAIDNSFLADQSVSSVAARTIAIQPDGKIVVGGDFTFSGGNGYIARLMPSGARDFSFAAGSGTNGIVWTSNILPGGLILLGGAFTSYNGNSQQRNLMVLNNDGTINTQYNFGTGFSGLAPSGVLSVTIQPDLKIIAGGEFNNFNGSNRNRLVRISNPTLSLSIVTQPVSASVCQGASHTFSVNASGTSPIAYQWLFNGNGISSSNGNSITVVNPGNYSVIVSNSSGSITSNTAVLSNSSSPVEPSNPSCYLKASHICRNTSGDRFFKLAWSSGAGSKRLVVVSPNPINHFPISGQSYTANSVYGMGQDLGNNTYVVYNGSSDSVSVSFGPSFMTRSFFAVFDYNEVCGNTNYLVSSFPTGFIEAKIPSQLCESSVDLESQKSDTPTDQNLDTNRIRIFPNPSNGRFNIVFPNNYSGNKIQFRIIDTTGKEVYTDSFENLEISLDLGRLSKGLYLVEASNGVDLSTGKLIVD